MEIQFTFGTIASAIIKLFVLMFIGYILYRHKLIDDKFVDMLSSLLVRIIFPALIISKIVTQFSFSEYTFWWVLPLTAIIFSLLGAAIGSVIYPFLKDFSSYKEFICGCAFQNCGYLPMNLILFAFAGKVADKLLIYTFLFIIGFNIIMWSFVPLFLSKRKKGIFNAGVLLNPPVIVTVFSLIWVALMGKNSMPFLLMEPIKQLGQAAFPLAMLTLGAYLYRYQAHNPPDKIPLIACSAVKLLFLPAFILIVFMFIPVSPDYKFFLFLQSMMPTAVSLVVIGSYVKCDNKFLSSAIFYTHLAAIFSIPLWLIVFNHFNK